MGGPGLNNNKKVAEYCNYPPINRKQPSLGARPPGGRGRTEPLPPCFSRRSRLVRLFGRPGRERGGGTDRWPERDDC